MKCKICEGHFNTNNSFSFLFYFPEICPSCEHKYKAETNKEFIPIDGGEICYIYLYDLPLNLVQRNYLERNLKIIYKQLKKDFEKYELFLMIDDFLIKEMADYWPLISPFKRICFFSLQYLDIMNWKFLE
jgi:hypothetical protein